MINIKTEKELITFLKIVSEEAVKESKKMLNENDPYQGMFKKKLETDNLLEADDDSEEEPSEEDTQDKKEKEKEKEESEKSDSNPAKEKALSLGGYDKDVGASFESVMTAINTMRAGRSLKDKEIKTELNDYYDRLDENERSVLLLFLKELSKILTGALDGEDAQDPSDPSTYFNITKRDPDEEKPGSEKNVIRKGGEEREAQVKDPASKQTTGPEDTSPPIKVNEAQDIQKLRAKVRQLMRS